MNIHTDIRSPNYDSRPVPVEFLVLHYTAGSLDRALSLFTDRSSEVSAHLVISEEGEIFELVECWEGVTYRAWHAGKSKWSTKERLWKNFNDFSIGIELVNLNGNLIPYTSQQYKTLTEVVAHLKLLYPNLDTPDRMLGHEHIADMTGKADPGCEFDWDLFFTSCYPDQEKPNRACVCPAELRSSLNKFLDAIPDDPENAVRFWHAVSDTTETTIRLLQEARGRKVFTRL